MKVIVSETFRIQSIWTFFHLINMRSTGYEIQVCILHRIRDQNIKFQMPRTLDSKCQLIRYCPAGWTLL